MQQKVGAERREVQRRVKVSGEDITEYVKLHKSMESSQHPMRVIAGRFALPLITLVIS